MEDIKKEDSVEVEETKAEETTEAEAKVETPEGAHIDEEGILEYDDTNASKLDKFFGVTKYGSSVRTEIIAGLVTFLSMCYILTLNPSIITGFGAGPYENLWSSIFIATAFGAIIGTLLMALVAFVNGFYEWYGAVMLLICSVFIFDIPYLFFKKAFYKNKEVEE